MYKNIVFDLDGTLIDSAPDICVAAGVALESVGLAPIDLETIIGFIGNGVEVLVRRAIDFRASHFEETDIQKALEEFLLFYGKNSAVNTNTYPGVKKTLGDLQSTGTPMGVCTNKPKIPASNICDQLGIDQYFQTIVGGDTVGIRKPNPAPLLFAIEALGGKPKETLYVGDSSVDYETAISAGVPFGFFEGGYQRKPIKDFAPNHVISSMGDLSQIVAGK